MSLWWRMLAKQRYFIGGNVVLTNPNKVAIIMVGQHHHHIINRDKP